MQAQRSVRIIGICGASATGKTVLATKLAEVSPVVMLSADWYFHKPRKIGPCRKSPCCWEQLSSVDLEALAQDLRELTTDLSRAPPGPVPDLLFGSSAHNVYGVGKNNPARITRDGFTLTNEPVVVVVEGFLLFGDPDVCEQLHAGIFLTADDGELLARRRFQRSGGSLEGAAAWASFRDEYMSHIYQHHLRAAPGMLANAASILCGTIKITESKTVDDVVAEAKALLEGGGDAGGAAVGNERAAPEAASIGSIGSPSSPTNAFDSPAPNGPPPCTPPPARSSMQPPAFEMPAFQIPQPTTASPESTLALLPPGSRVAVLDFLGSFCPITAGHVQCMTEARRILLGQSPPINADGALKPFDACLGALTVNSDSHVHAKLSRSGENMLSSDQRLQLCGLATASEVAWIRAGTPAGEWVASLRAAFPSITFTIWMLNGADDVVRYEKWEWASTDSPLITMGRPGGDVPIILNAISKESLKSDAFVLGPELLDVSSSAAREALRREDHAAVAAFLHPLVAAWLKQQGPYRACAHGPPATATAPLAGTGTLLVRGAGFGSAPRQLRAAEFGVTLPAEDGLLDGVNGQRQKVLLDTLTALEEASPTAKYHTLAQLNLRRWHEQAVSSGVTPTAAGKLLPPSSSCKVIVRAGDWGEVALLLTKELGKTFAVLNMANAVGPGGGYTHGMVAQEENMFRRTDCHFSLDRSYIEPTTEEYVSRMSSLLEARDGRVYLDTDHPRVCIRGPEQRGTPDLGYAWLADADVFPFYELRAAAVDLRDGRRSFSEEETARRVRAQLDTLVAAGIRHAVLSAFGCGAFMNPAGRVAAVYASELRRRTADFDVVAFAIFHAGYGPDNFAPFEAAFDSWECAGHGMAEAPRASVGAHLMGSPCASGSPPPLSRLAMPPPRPSKKAGKRNVETWGDD